MKQKEVEMSFKNATGKMSYTLKNDYLFRATLQKNNKALKGLICAVLGLKPEKVVSVEVTNPIELGKSIEAKDFLLDVRVLLNNNVIINMEMQVLNLGNWAERSLAYLCRSFDQLNSGADYKEVMPVIQVCFLDFTLFEEMPEFFSTYMFTNIKNYSIYSDKIKLFVVDLTKVDMATEEDKSRKIDYWAKLFKATTWEEVKMLAENNTYLEEAAETAYKLSAEEMIRLQCEAREDYYRQQSYIKKRMAEADAIFAEHDAIMAKIDAMTRKADAIAAEMDAMTRKADAIAAEMNAIAAEKDAIAAEKDAIAAEKDSIAAKLDAALVEKDAAVAAVVAERDEMAAKYEILLKKLADLEKSE